MNINEAPLDRALRGVISVAIIATPVMGLDTSPLNWLGFIPFATAIIGVCPLYKALGFTTVREGSYMHQKEGLEIKGAATATSTSRSRDEAHA